MFKNRKYNDIIAFHKNLMLKENGQVYAMFEVPAMNLSRTDEQAKEIFNSQLSHRKLAKLYNITNSIVWRIKNKKAYKHLW